MGIDDINSVHPSVADLFPESTSRAPSNVLGQDDFLKLLVAQMTSQDPMNPMSNTDFIAQMAQFTSLEQTRTMSNTMTQMSQQQQVLQASGLIGRAVTLVDDDKNIVQGVVSGIAIEKGSPFIVVAGQRYSLASVTSVTLLESVAVPDPIVSTDPVPAPAPEVPVLSQTTN